MLREHFLPLVYDQNFLGVAHCNASCFTATHIDLLRPPSFPFSGSTPVIQFWPTVTIIYSVFASASEAGISSLIAVEHSQI